MEVLTLTAFYFLLLQLVKQAILPRVHGLALKTTVAAVCSFMYLLYLNCSPSLALSLHTHITKAASNVITEKP